MVFNLQLPQFNYTPGIFSNVGLGLAVMIEGAQPWCDIVAADFELDLVKVRAFLEQGFDHVWTERMIAGA